MTATSCISVLTYLKDEPTLIPYFTRLLDDIVSTGDDDVTVVIKDERKIVKLFKFMQWYMAYTIAHGGTNEDWEEIISDKTVLVKMLEVWTFSLPTKQLAELYPSNPTDVEEQPINMLLGMMKFVNKGALGNPDVLVSTLNPNVMWYRIAQLKSNSAVDNLMATKFANYMNTTLRPEIFNKTAKGRKLIESGRALLPKRGGVQQIPIPVSAAIKADEKIIKHVEELLGIKIEIEYVDNNYEESVIPFPDVQEAEKYIDTLKFSGPDGTLAEGWDNDVDNHLYNYEPWRSKLAELVKLVKDDKDFKDMVANYMRDYKCGAQCEVKSNDIAKAKLVVAELNTAYFDKEWNQVLAS